MKQELVHLPERGSDCTIIRPRDWLSTAYTTINERLCTSTNLTPIRRTGIILLPSRIRWLFLILVLDWHTTSSLSCTGYRLISIPPASETISIFFSRSIVIEQKYPILPNVTKPQTSQNKQFLLFCTELPKQSHFARQERGSHNLATDVESHGSAS